MDTSEFTPARRPRAAMATLVGLAMLAHAGCAYLNHNFRVVEPGRFFRSGQMSDVRLAHTIRENGIRTVVNLRGAHPEEAWYSQEIGVCAELGVAHHDLAWSMNRLPDPGSLAAFVRLCTEAQTPILVHCQGGTHRAGVASAVYRLARGGDLEVARREFHLFFNDAPIGGVLNLYEGSGLPFGEWVSSAYPRLYQQASEPANTPASRDG